MCLAGRCPCVHPLAASSRGALLALPHHGAQASPSTRRLATPAADLWLPHLRHLHVNLMQGVADADHVPTWQAAAHETDPLLHLVAPVLAAAPRLETLHLLVSGLAISEAGLFGCVDALVRRREGPGTLDSLYRLATKKIMKTFPLARKQASRCPTLILVGCRLMDAVAARFLRDLSVWFARSPPSWSGLSRLRVDLNGNNRLEAPAFAALDPGQPTDDDGLFCLVPRPSGPSCVPRVPGTWCCSCGTPCSATWETPRCPPSPPPLPGASSHPPPSRTSASTSPSVSPRRRPGCGPCSWRGDAVCAPSRCTWAATNGSARRGPRPWARCCRTRSCSLGCGRPSWTCPTCASQTRASHPASSPCSPVPCGSAWCCSSAETTWAGGPYGCSLIWPRAPRSTGASMPPTPASP